MTAEDLVLTLPVMDPRHYCISSASEVHPQRLKLTVDVVKVSLPPPTPACLSVHSLPEPAMVVAMHGGFLAFLSPSLLVHLRALTTAARTSDKAPFPRNECCEAPREGAKQEG